MKITLFNNLIKQNYYNQINFIFKQNFIGKLIKKGNKFYALKFYNKLKYNLKKKIRKDPNLVILITLIYSIIRFYFIKKRLGGTKKDIPIYLNKQRQVKFIIRKIFSITKSINKRKSLDLNKLVLLYFNTIKRKGPLIINKYKAFVKAKENKILLRFLKK